MKIRTIITLFFAFLGATLFLKFLAYNVVSNRIFSLDDNIYQEAFIALFISVMLTLFSGLKLKWVWERKK